MVEIEAFCEKCDKFVPVKTIRITNEGRIYLYLKCKHFTGFLFGGILKFEKKKR